MRRKRAEFEIFNLSFLDVISCGFGAVVLLVLISPFGVSDEAGGTDETSTLLQRLIGTEARIEQLEAALGREAETLAQTRARLEAEGTAVSTAERDLRSASDTAAELARNVEGLQTVESALRNQARAGVSAPENAPRDAEVGGIPVDSEFVVFVVDTSESMQSIWERVTREVENIIRIHPQIKGFQVLNDNGTHLIGGYRGRWIPDTKGARDRAIRLFRSWKSASNSSPVEGLEVALKRYVKPNEKVSIYIFGDDYTGSSYDPVIATLSRLNKNRITGEPKARVHAIGFISLQTEGRFETLMREVTRQNNGTFVALPR
ncbi:MAG: hypothetical protein HOK11_09815 [Rhodospirillaceae bacterium]|nr:hypothetical protein [Rhodospirillaceae bacterium]MBT6404715.1 hypothetical protein [Rhodospirillaceae bacterium]MBT7366093.1 hypothetical protein [Rhodospirillaceae bacterium]